VCKGLRELDEGKGIPDERIREEFSEWLYTLIWSPAAQFNLKDIAAFIAEDSASAVERFVRH